MQMHANPRARRTLSCLASALKLLIAAPTAVGALTLVEDGVSRMPVVVFENAPPMTRQAADELAEYIERASGVRPEVIEGAPDPVPDHAIWVGYQPVLDQLFPEIDFNFQHPEEILIAVNDKHLVIAGRDLWDPDNMVRRRGRGRDIQGVQQEYGTVNAVYTFLQDYLGVRWIWPGDLGLDVLERDTIAFEPFEYRYHPQMRWRHGIFALSMLGGTGNFMSDWTRVQRLQLDSLNIHAGHAFTDWWERFGKTNPEYFALQPDGSRGGGENPFPDARTVKLCRSNPGMLEQWLRDVEAQIEEDPSKTVFSVGENDSWARGWCICEHCVAWDHPEGEPRAFSWKGLSQEYVALSDRLVTFANKAARALRERYPDKNYYVSMGAYGHSRPRPIEAVPDDNVIIAACANFTMDRRELVDRGSSWGTKHRDQFKAWSEVTDSIAWRPNTGSPHGWRSGMPAVYLNRWIEDFQFVAGHGAIGIYIDTVWEYPATQGAAYYVMAQLAWNPDADPDEILRDFFERGFGPAAAEVEGYWRFLDANIGNYDEEGYFEEAYGYLDRAAAAVEDAPEKYAGRIDYLRMGLDYTRLQRENLVLVKACKASDGQDTESRDRAYENWKKISEMSVKYPNGMNWGRLEPRHGRTASYHPDGSRANIRLPHVD